MLPVRIGHLKLIKAQIAEKTVGIDVKTKSLKELAAATREQATVSRLVHVVPWALTTIAPLRKQPVRRVLQLDDYLALPPWLGDHRSLV